MVIRICPNCQRRYVYTLHSGDYVHQCNSGDDTLDQEDVFVIGDWEDYTGSGTENPQLISQAGLGNELQFDEAGIKGANITSEYTNRGKNAKLYRQRQYLEYIPDLEKEEC